MISSNEIEHGRNEAYSEGDTVLAFSKHIFIASFIFLMAKSIDSRDFPVHGVPLVYPAFVAYLLLIGKPRMIWEGIRRTRFLIALISCYWIYHTLLKIALGLDTGFESLAFLLEPIMLFVVAGTATVPAGGKRAVIWAFIIVVIVSTLFGFGSIFIGGKFLSINDMLHSAHLAGTKVGRLYRLTQGNAGLSVFIFKFAYQLATAMMIVFALLVGKGPKNIEKILLWACFIVLAAGILSNGERSPVVAITMGTIVYIFLKKKYALIPRLVVVLLFFVGLMYIKTRYFSAVEGLDTLTDRMDLGADQYQRVRAALAAVSSIFSSPLGSGDMAPSYMTFARKYHFVNSSGEILMAHNDFANAIMATGFIGVIVIGCLSIYLLKMLLAFRKNYQKFQYETAVAAGCIAALVNSLAHNQGFFTREFAICFTLGFISAVYRESKQDEYARRIRQVTM